jgi:hypothetical protein
VLQNMPKSSAGRLPMRSLMTPQTNDDTHCASMNALVISPAHVAKVLQFSEL